MSRVSPLRAAVATGLTLGTATIGLAFAPSAFAAATLPEIALSATTVLEGGSITASGTQCILGETDDEIAVVVYLDGEADNPDAEPAVAEVAANGSWSLPLAFLHGSAGTHEVDAFCAHYNTTDGVTSKQDYPVGSITVTAAAPSAPAPSAPASVVAFQPR